MFRTAYNQAMGVAAAAVRAVNASEYVMDYSLERLIAESSRIGEKLLAAEVSYVMVPGHRFQSKDAMRYSHLTLYWMKSLELRLGKRRV